MIGRHELAPLRHTRFRYFISARLSSLLGNAIAPIALAFAVLDLTGSASALGLVLAARAVPMVLFILFGGVVGDRFRRDRVLVVSHTLAFATQAIAATLLLTGNAQVWQLVAIEAVNGAAAAFTFPAMLGIVPLIVPRGELQQANALNGLTRNATVIGGGTLAGMIVSFAGPGWGIAIDAATFGIAAMLLARIRLSDTPASDGGTTWRDLRDGWAEFTARRWVWVIVLAFGVVNAAIACGLHTLGPVVADQTFGRLNWGILQSAFGVGLVLGAVLMLRWKPQRPLIAGMLGALLTSGQLLMLGLNPSVVPLIAVYFLAGIGLDVFGVGWETSLQQNIPQEKLSRVFSYDAFGSFVAIPVGQLAAGPLAAAFDVRNVVTACGVIVLVACASTLADRSVRGLRRVDPTPVDVS